MLDYIISTKKLAANRANAKKSTGPTTEKGKAASSLNRLSHGFNSATRCIRGEDPEEFEALRAGLHAELKPVTEMETILVDKMVLAQWHSLRATRLINDNLAGLVIDTQHFALFIRYQTTSDRTFHKSHVELQKLQSRRKEEATSPDGFVSQKPAEGSPEPPHETAKPATAAAAPAETAASAPETGKSLQNAARKSATIVSI